MPRAVIGRGGPWALALVLLFAATTRGAYLLTYRAFDPYYSVPIIDAARYDRWGLAIARGETFENGPYYQAPLYPYFVGALYRTFGHQPLAVYVAQMLAGLVTVWLIHRIAARAYGSRAGLAAAALAALYGVFLFNETKLLPVSLTILLASLAVDRLQTADATSRVRDGGLAGLALGVAALASAGLLLLAAGACACILVDRRAPFRTRGARLLPLLIGVALAVAPVTIRNAVVGRDLVLIAANGGVTFYQGNNPETILAGGGFVAPEGLSGLITTQREESRRLAEREEGRALRDSEVSGHYFRKGWAFIFGEPVAYLHLLARKVLRALDSYEPALEYNAALDPNRVRLLVPLPFGLVLALACLRVFAGPLRRREVPLLLLLGAQTVTLLAFFVAGRYRLPLMPALLVLAGGGAVMLLDRWRTGTSLRAALVLGASVAVLSTIALPRLHRPLQTNEEAQGWTDRAFAYEKVGKPNEAIALHRRALSLAPELARAHLDLGRLLMETGDVLGAEATLRRAAELDPEDIDTHHYLGTLAYRAGRIDEAATHFMRAYALAPHDAQLAHNVLVAYIQSGRTSEAAEVWREAKTRGLVLDPQIEASLFPTRSGGTGR